MNFIDKIQMSAARKTTAEEPPVRMNPVRARGMHPMKAARQTPEPPDRQMAARQTTAGQTPVMQEALMLQARAGQKDQMPAGQKAGALTGQKTRIQLQRTGMLLSQVPRQMSKARLRQTSS